MVEDTVKNVISMTVFGNSYYVEHKKWTEMWIILPVN